MEQLEMLAPLKEVATVAAGNAATALSTLMKQPVTVSVPTAHLLDVEQAIKALGPTQQVATAGLVKIEGDAQGLLIFTLHPDDANDIAQHLVQQHTDSSYNDVDQSVLREVVNITGGAALSALGTFLGMHLWQSVPGSTTDMIGAVLDPFIAELGASYDKVLVLQEVFTMPVQGASVKMLTIIDPPSTTLMLQKISEKLRTAHGPNN
jgi:chemotaxis protein CheC